MGTQSDTDGRAQILTQRNEYVKQYVVLDGSSRASAVYTAHRTAKVGEPCEVTQYMYDGVSTTIIGRSETEATWLQAYEDALVGGGII